MISLLHLYGTIRPFYTVCCCTVRSTELANKKWFEKVDHIIRSFFVLVLVPNHLAHQLHSAQSL